MRKLLILGLFLSISTSLFADNRHVHPHATKKDLTPTEQNADWFRYCDIKIHNKSYEDVHVQGVFDDGSSMEPFNVYSFESPHYISLYYYGYCHSGMDLYIDTWSGYRIYAAYTPSGRTIHIVPRYSNQLKSEVSVN